MANNGSTSVAVTAYDSLRFTWWTINQSAENNRSFIGWELQLVSGSNGLISSTATKAWSVTVNGTTYSGTNSVGIANNTVKTLASGQTVIPHNADGTKAFSYSFSQEFSITFAGASVGTKSGSGTGTLDPVARATAPTLSVSSVDMGGKVTISTPRASTAFKHDLAYAFAGGSYVSIATDVSTSHTWTVPLSLADSIPNTTSGTVTIRCITKNGSATVGTKTVLLTVKVPSSVVPTISAVTTEEATSGIAAQFGAFVQSKSKIKASITASGASGSTIKSYTSTLMGKTYTGASWTSDILAQSGTLSLVTTVTDSRGRTASKTTNVTVLAYTPPRITAFSVARFNAVDVADPNGTYVRARLVYSVASLGGKNTATAKVEYKKSTDQSWTTLVTRTELSMDGTLMPQGTTFSTDYQWDFRVSLTDAFNSATPATYTAVLPSGAVILDIRADGKGIAFFKTSTKEGVDIPGALPGSPIALTTGQDLDYLTTPGFYVIETAYIMGTLQHKPNVGSTTGSLRVEDMGSGQLKQTLQTAVASGGALYERGLSPAGTWSSWNFVYSYSGPGKIIWSGSSLLTASQTVTFNESISKQQSGIVLVFTRYASGAAVDYFYSCHFVPKQVITAAMSAGQSAAGVTFMMATNKFEYIAGKYLRIVDTKITGDDNNSATGTSNGITFNNGQFALRYVIGV